MIDETLVNRIAELAVQAEEPKVIEIDGVPHTTRKLIDARPVESSPAPLRISSLTGFVDYVASNPDNLNLGDCIAVIAAPDRVELVSKLVGVHNQRHVYVEATAVAGDLRDVLDHHLIGMDVETAIIRLKTWFTDAGDRDEVVRLLGNLTDEDVTTLVDDGFTQKATVRAGIQVVDQVKLPNPVVLAPWRTFGGIEQPSSPYLLRVKKSDSGPTVSLTIADDLTWRLEAVGAIDRWIRKELGDSPLKILR